MKIMVLDLHPFCEHCDRFDPTKNVHYSEDKPYLTFVTCTHYLECKNMADYIKSHMLSEIKNKDSHNE